MTTLRQEIESFTTFAQAKIAQGTNVSIDELYDQWREGHPSTEDELAIRASLRDLANGETGRPFEEFAAEFRQRNKL